MQNSGLKRRITFKTFFRSKKDTFFELVERAPFGIYIVDSGFCIAHMNINAQNGAFRNVRPVIGRDFSEAMHILWSDDIAEGIISAFRQTLKTGDPYYSPPFINPRHDIEIQEAYEWELQRIVLPDGQYGVICYYFDYTPLREAERVAHESEEKYRKIVETAGEGIIIASPEGQFQFVNKKFAEMLGYTPDEIIGKNSQEYMFDDQQAVQIKKVRKQLKKGETTQDIMRFRHKDGSVLWTLYNATPIYDSSGTHSGNLAMHINITNRVMAEEQLRQTQLKLQVALDSGKIGVWEWNLMTNEVVWDERMEKLFGLKPGTFGKSYQAFEKLINEEDISHVRKAIKESLEKDIPLETVFRLRSENKKEGFISSRAIPNKDKDGKPIGFTGVCFDVSGLHLGTEKLVAKLNEELLRSNKELERFAYVASHDLQEPLRMVSSFTQLLELQYKDRLDDRALEYINFAVDGSKRMYDLLNGLLAYSRIHTKGKSFNRVELSKVLENTKQNLGIKIKERNAIIKSGELPSVYADESQMTQLFQNLILNSIKFCSESPEIYISSKSDSDHYIISVRDNGIGIESQYLDRIFEIFQRLFPKGVEYEGTGIGLAICKRIVERHGGKIWAESVPKKGSTFFFTIPKNNQGLGDWSK